MNLRGSISRRTGHAKRALEAILSERSAVASLIALLSLALFGILGPLLYPVDPDTVFYIYRASIYLANESRATEIYTLSNILVTASAPIDGGFILYAERVGGESPGGSLYIVDLSHNNKPRVSVFRFNVSVSSIGVMNSTVVLGSGDSIYIAMYRGGAPSDPKEIFRASSRIEGLIPISGGVAWWDSKGRISLLRLGANGFHGDPLLVAELGWAPQRAAECRQSLIFVGPGGRISTVDLGDGSVRTYQPIFEDLLSVVCVEGRVIAAGRYGSMVLLSGGAITPIATGVVDDLIRVIPAGDHALVVGSRGSIVSIDLERRVLSVREVRGVSGVKDSVMGNGTLYLLSYGVFVSSLEPPSPRHPFGTNYYGKDLVSQVMVGVRMSLLIGVAVAVVVITIGSIVGMLSGYFRGRVDTMFNTVINFVYTIPLEPFAILLAMLLRPSMLTVIIAISVLIWRTTARIIRSQTISVASSQMVEAARALGAGHSRIIAKYILPAVLPLVLLDFASVVAYAILAEATLGFLGVSAQDTYTLGSILNQARLTGAWRDAWWWVAIPGVFIGSISLSIYMLVRSLEPIANPRIRRTLQPS